MCPCSPLADPRPARRAAPVRCVALAPHFEGEATAADFEQKVREIKEIGANLVLVVVQWGQVDHTSDTLGPYQWGTDDAEVRTLIGQARAAGLDVLVFPIVKLARILPGRWRGTLAPRPPPLVGRLRGVHPALRHPGRRGRRGLALGGQRAGHDGARRGRLAPAHRPRARRFPGRLTYSANWDHFHHVGFWDALDVIGLNAYHPVTARDGATVLDLARSWRTIRRWLLAWHGWLPQPLLFTEVGYPSVEGGARRPYHYGADTAVDLAEQARAYAAFIETWRDQPGVAGGCIWIWTGAGGAATPATCPAASPPRRSSRPGSRGPERSALSDKRGCISAAASARRSGAPPPGLRADRPPARR
ncbi:MAG: hypothetical protein R3F43_05010 [bacterium]